MNDPAGEIIRGASEQRAWAEAEYKSAYERSRLAAKLSIMGIMTSQKQGIFEAHDPAMFVDGQPLYAPFGSYVCNLAEPVTCDHCGHTQRVDWKHALHVCDGVLLSKWTRPEPMPSCPRCGEPKPITYRRNPEPGVPEETHWSEEPLA